MTQHKDTVLPAFIAEKEFTITDKYIEYIKSTRNPYKWGLRSDGRFYPYCRPQGRMIAYGQRVFDKRYYADGMSDEEAESNLRLELNNALTALRAYMEKFYPEHHFDLLSRKSQEILLDLAFSEGAENLSERFYSVVINEDWDAMFNEFLYIRWVEKGWTCTISNKAFVDRWMNPQERHLPTTNPLSVILNRGYGE